MIKICNNIKITSPRPYEEVGISFVISGWVPKSWLATSRGFNNKVFLDFIDIDGQTFIGSSADVIADRSWLSRFRKRVPFYLAMRFDQLNAHFIIKSEGRIAIKFSGHKEDCQIFIPIIIKSSNPNFKPSSEIVKKHREIGKMVFKYENDLRDYNAQLEKIEESRRNKADLIGEGGSFLYARDPGLIMGVAGILQESEDDLGKDYPFLEEDLQEKELEEKYKDAIKWRGPLLTGIVGRMNGYEFRLYSSDHDSHFHVINRSKKINARFSFPEIKLMNYKNTQNSIGGKERNKIVAFFQNPDNFKKLEEEFKRVERRTF